MLIAAINPTVAPIQYIDDDGNIVGLDVDVGNAIAARLCLKMEFQSTQFATMIPLLKEGRIDLIDSFMFYTPERAAQVLMVPYGASSMAIVVAKNNKDEIGGPEYFSGKRMGVELGTVDLADAKAASEALEKAGKPAINDPDLQHLCRRAAGAEGRPGGRRVHRHRASLLFPQEGPRLLPHRADRLRPARRGAGLQAAGAGRSRSSR